MLDIELLCDISHVSFREPAPQWLLSGDFNQYLPFFNTFRGRSLVKPFEDSALLHHLAGGSRVTLAECRRSDAELFAFYASLIPGGTRRDRPLEDNVAEAKQIFHAGAARGFIPDTALAPTNLVLSHKLRIELNARCNAADARGREGVVYFVLQDYYTPEELQHLNTHANQPQDALFWPGLVVMSRCTNSKLKNALPYEILAFEGDRVRLRSAGQAPDDEREVAKVVLSRSAFFKSMRLQYALTYASIQGVTIKTLLALHDTSHPHFDARKLFVGISRAVAHNLLIVY